MEIKLFIQLYCFTSKVHICTLREEDFQKSTNLKQELPVAAMFVNGSKRNEQIL
jgi:hypothetical protein